MSVNIKVFLPRFLKTCSGSSNAAWMCCFSALGYITEPEQGHQRCKQCPYRAGEGRGSDQDRMSNRPQRRHVPGIVLGDARGVVPWYWTLEVGREVGHLETTCELLCEKIEVYALVWFLHKGISEVMHSYSLIKIDSGYFQSFNKFVIVANLTLIIELMFEMLTKYCWHGFMWNYLYL